jgi:hypothetical protein
MYTDQHSLSTWGANGRAFACRQFDSKTQAERIEKLFTSLCNHQSYEMNDPWDETSSPD